MIKSLKLELSPYTMVEVMKRNPGHFSGDDIYCRIKDNDGSVYLDESELDKIKQAMEMMKTL